VLLKNHNCNGGTKIAGFEIDRLNHKASLEQWTLYSPSTSSR